MVTAGQRVALVLSGGGSLGAFQGGVYESLAADGILPAIAAGSSIGAVNAALIAGNAPEARVERLRAFWERVADPVTEGGIGSTDIGRTAKAAAALHGRLAGRPGLYRPIFPQLFLAERRWSSPSVYDHREAAATLRQLLDFARFGRETALVANLTDLLSGHAVVVSSERQPVTAEHLLASMALIPDFPPVEVDGRLYADGGLSANLPLHAVLDPAPDDRLLVIAVDLLGHPGRPAFSVDGMLERSNDLTFVNQTRTLLALHGLRQRLHGKGAVTVVMLAYDSSGERIAQKTWDFGRRSIEARWAAGRAAGRGLAHFIEALPATRAGQLAVHQAATTASGEGLAA